MSERKVALVTGASGGIGGACALELARQGFDIGVHYHRNAETAQAIVADIQAAGAQAWPLLFDAADPEQIEKSIRQFIKERKRLDVLVATAGVVVNQMMALTSIEELDTLWAVNLRGAFWAAKTASKAMLRQRWGRVVFVGSIVGQHGNAGQSAYAASKGGLIGLAKSMARELAPRHVTVNVVAPGLVETNVLKDLTEQQTHAILQQVPLGRMGQPEDVAAAVAFLCSEAAGYITGAVLNVDGGLGT